VRDFGDPILELGCGTGRITMALAEAGKRITGLDLSGRMLERAVKKRAALRVEARERVHGRASSSRTSRNGRRQGERMENFSATSGPPRAWWK